MLKKKIVDASTGQKTWVDLTPEEVAQVEAARAEAEAEAAEQAAKVAARLAVLQKLGLTDDEIAALGL